ncbi:hypothetical protein TWF730_000692 [Orbilia blumenaviensis]|uniref:Uncharacterized protein n=1 Tax=Orbilia blumenaviensis TaxID=1796055 RepID=A0AAV9VQ38_9PEZI
MSKSRQARLQEVRRTITVQHKASLYDAVDEDEDNDDKNDEDEDGDDEKEKEGRKGWKVRKTE